MKTILIVDDEPRTRQGIKRTLESWSPGHYQFETFASAQEAMDWLESNEAVLLITDIRMPEINGLRLIEEINDKYPALFVIVISGYSEFEYARTALQYGVIDYLLKPIDKNKLTHAVEVALERNDQKQRIERMEKIVDTRLMSTSDGNNQYSEPVREAINYIEAHLEEPISLRELAEVSHMNANYFSVLFKEHTGLTFSDYLTRRRVQRAKELIVGTTLSVNEISERVGYQTAKYFIKVFRKLEGMSPGQYRQQMNESNN